MNHVMPIIFGELETTPKNLEKSGKLEIRGRPGTFQIRKETCCHSDFSKGLTCEQ